MFDELRRAVKHAFIYGIGDILMKAIGFILMPIYLHYLTADQYGILELLDLSVYIVGLLLAWVSGAVVRFYYIYEGKDRLKVVSTALITIWVVSLPLLVILLVYAENISIIVFDTAEYTSLFRIIFLTMTMTTSSTIPRSLMQVEQRSTLYSVTNVVRLTLSLVLNILFVVYYGLGVEGILWAGLISNFVVGAALVWYMFAETGFAYSFRMMADMVRFGLPLMLTWFAMFVINFGDRFFLQRFGTLQDVGLYALAYKFGMLVGVLVLTPFMLIWGPRRFAIMEEESSGHTYTMMFTYLMYVLLFVGLGICVLVRDVLIIIADPEYHSAYKYVSPIVLSYVLYAAFQYIQFGVLLEKKTKYIAYATWTGMAVNLLGNYFFVPKYGLWGASLTTLLTFAVLVAYMYPVAQRFYRITYEIGRVARMACVAAVLFLLSLQLGFLPTGVALPLRMILVLSFPFALWLVGFYQESELSAIRSAGGRARAVIKRKISGSR